MLPFIFGGWLMTPGATKRQVALFLKERSQESSFFQRHKEVLKPLIIALVAAIAGAVVKGLFGKQTCSRHSVDTDPDVINNNSMLVRVTLC